MYLRQYLVMRGLKPYRRFFRHFPRLHFFSFTLGISLSLFASFFQLFTSSPVPVPRPLMNADDLNSISKDVGTTLNLSYTIGQVSHPNAHEVFADLLAFTGLNESELLSRLQHTSEYHFNLEHHFQNAQSSRESAFLHRHSLGYLWGNAIHHAVNFSALSLTPNGPVLDFSGGLGGNCLALAKLGIECIYTGTGLVEFEFAQFRAKRHGVDHMIQFIKPYANGKFDPLGALEVGNSLSSKLGVILALDVFNHITDYHVTAQHLVSLLVDGGILYERSGFENEAGNHEIDQKVTIPIHEALTGMTLRGRILGSKIVAWVKDVPEIYSSSSTDTTQDSKLDNADAQVQDEEHVNESKHSVDNDKLQGHTDETDDDSETNHFEKRADQ